MDYTMTILVDEFSNFFNIFCRFAVLGRPERSSSSTDTLLDFASIADKMKHEVEKALL
jgi:hypothetical protein